MGDIWYPRDGKDENAPSKRMRELLSNLGTFLDKGLCQKAKKSETLWYLTHIYWELDDLVLQN